MRNSFASARTPHYCQHSRYTPGVGAEGCTFRYEHDGKHSFDKDSEADEEGDMQAPGPRALACDKSVTCPADFHDIGCQTDYRETVQAQGSPQHFIGLDGTTVTTYEDGSMKIVDSIGRVSFQGPLSPDARDEFRSARGFVPTTEQRARFIIEQAERVKAAQKPLVLHTSEEKTGGRAEVSHHTAGGMETIDFIYAKLGIDGGHDYVLGNILKYAARAKYKGQFESDVEKIRNYAVIMQEQEAKREDKTNG